VSISGEDGLKALEVALAIDPERAELYLTLADLYTSQGNQIEALKILNDAKENMDNDVITLKLSDISSGITVDAISETVLVGEKYSLPDEVNVKINNNETQLPVDWESPSADTSKAGKYVFNGVVENTDKKVQLNLNVVGILSIADISAAIKQNDSYSLPAKVSAKMTDISTRDTAVVWDPPAVDTSRAGTFYYQGSVSGYGNKVKLTLKIESLATDFKVEIRSTNKPPISTASGDADNNELWIRYSDGREELLLTCRDSGDINSMIAGMSDPMISLDKTKIYFMAALAATSGGLHVFDLNTRTHKYLCPANSAGLIDSGTYKGKLLVSQHDYYGPPDYGSYEHYFIIDENGNKIKDLGEKPEGF
jgi:hypothetical protein